LPCSQEPTPLPYPEPDESTSYSLFLLSKVIWRLRHLIGCRARGASPSKAACTVMQVFSPPEQLSNSYTGSRRSGFSDIWSCSRETNRKWRWRSADIIRIVVHHLQCTFHISSVLMGKLRAKDSTYFPVSVKRLLWYTVHNFIMAEYCGLNVWGLISGTARDFILFSTTRSIRLVRS
jgi:hypothetical protein